MKYKDIFLNNIEDNRIQLVKGIQEIGMDLAKSSKVIKRRELVEALNQKFKFKIKDGLIINLLVKEAYNNSQYSESLKKVLVNNIEDNNSNNKVYNPKRVYIQPNCWNFDENKLVTDISLIIQNQQIVLKNDGIGLINKAVEDVELINAEQVISLTGGSKVEAYSVYALKVKGGYEKIIETYEFIKNQNLDLISDFEDIRNELKIVREDVLNLLIDVFGNSIRSTDPEMFNFSKINWIDFENTWNKLILFYDNINENIETFKKFHKIQLDNISTSSIQSVNSFFDESNKLLKKNGTLSSKDIKDHAITAGVGLLFDAGISVLKSRGKAKKTIESIKRDVEKLKFGMRNDVEQILNDIIRLGSLQTEIKDKLLPQLKIFISQIYKKINIGIIPIYKEIISDNNIENLRNSNIKLTDENRKIEKALIDEKNKIEFSKKYFLKLENFINKNAFEYKYVQTLYPSKPKGIYKILSPNKSKILFDKTLNNWDKYCKPKIEEYETVIVNHQKEINLQKEIINDVQLLQKRKIEIEQILTSNSEKISTLFKDNSINNDLLKKLVFNVKEIVTSSKSVLEVELKEQLLTI